MPDDIILLIEDNPDHAVLVQALLDYRNLGKHVYVTQSLAEAKSYLLGEWPFDDPNRSPTPRLIVLDHWLNDGTGLDFLEWLRETPGLSGLPVILFTACRDPEVRERALGLGVKDYFTKPEGFDALGKAIEDIVRPASRANGNRKGKEPGSAQTG